VEVFVPRGYYGKMVTYKCGNTGVDGYPVLCMKCAKDFDRTEFRRQIEAAGESIEEV
jgi:hypothetical protein